MKPKESFTPIEVALTSLPLLKGLEARHVRVLADCATRSSFGTGEIIFRQGDIANRFYLIESGEVGVESRQKEGEPIRIQTLGAGETVGWSWLFPPYRWHFDARALRPVQAIFLYGTRARGHCEDDHELGYELMKRVAEVMMERLQATQRQLTDISALALRSQWEALFLAAQLGAGRRADIPLKETQAALLSESDRNLRGA